MLCSLPTPKWNRHNRTARRRLCNIGITKMEEQKYIFKVVKSRPYQNSTVDEVVALIYNNKHAIVEIIREILNDNFGRDPNFEIEIELWPLDMWYVGKRYERISAAEFARRFFPGLLNKGDEAGSKTN